MTRAIQPHKNISGQSFVTRRCNKEKKEINVEKLFQHFYVIVNKTNNEGEKFV